MQKTNFNRLPLQEMIPSSTKRQEVLRSSEYDQIELLNKNMGMLINLVSEVKQDLKVVDNKVDGTITKVGKLEDFLSTRSFDADGSKGCPLPPGHITVNSNLSPISGLTEEEGVQDKFWRLSDLTNDLKLRFSDPKELEEIAATTGADCLMMIR